MMNRLILCLHRLLLLLSESKHCLRGCQSRHPSFIFPGIWEWAKTPAWHQHSSTHCYYRKILNYHFCFLQGRSRSLWGWRSDAAGRWRRNPLKTSGWDGGCRRKRSLQLHVHPQDSAAWRTWSPRSWRQGRQDPRRTASCAQDRPGNPQVRPFLLSKPRKRKKYQ